jgi:cytochrome c biogenesis factor
MCDPGTLLIAATIGGTALSAVGAMAQGQASYEAAQAQQAALNQQAEADQKAAAFEAAREHRKQQLARSAAIAQVASSGVGLAGSPTEVLAANAREGQLDIAAIQYGSQLRQNQLRTQGKIAAFQGRQARTAGYINAGSAIFSGASSYASNSIRLGQNPFQ